MAQINTNKGITLIELLLYMALFSIIFLIVNSSTFYLQKIIQTNNQNYYVKNQIYTELNILQQYLKTHLVVLDNQDLKFFNKTSDPVLTIKAEEGILVHTYRNKKIAPLEYVTLTEYIASITDRGTILEFNFSWVDTRGKTQNLKEYLIVINRNM